MAQTEIMKLAAQAHNCIVQIRVSGDDTILMASAISALRELVAGLRDGAGEEAGQQAEGGG